MLVAMQFKNQFAHVFFRFYVVAAIFVSEFSYSDEGAVLSSDRVDALFAHGFEIPLTNSKGIYVVDNRQGTFRDEAIRDYDFVDGLAWRFSWADIETAEGVYDFSGFEHILSRLSEIDQKLSWLIMPTAPEYITQHATLNGYSDPEGLMFPFPWDNYVVNRYQSFITAVAEYEVFDASRGENVPIKYHSNLYAVHPSFPGVTGGAIRDHQVKIVDIPGFERDLFINQSIIPILVHTRQNFPKSYIHVGLWNIRNDTFEPDLTEAIRQTIIQLYPNTSGGHIGLFMDNLAASMVEEVSTGYPNTGFGSTLFLSQDDTYIAFQALSSWIAPFNPNHVPKVEGGTVVQGMEYGLNVYNARYFELYPSDLDHMPWQQSILDFYNENLMTD